MKIRLLLASAVVCGALVACGGNDNPSSPPTTTTPTTPPAANNSFNTFVVNAISQQPAISDTSEPTAVEGVTFTFNDDDATSFNAVLPP